MPASPQILLPLEQRRPDRFEDFVTGPNAAVVAALREVRAGGERCVFLHGPEGSGKSHLLNALCNRVQESGGAAFYIVPGALPESAAASLGGLECFELVCVDDIDLVAGSPGWEEALFHCFNRLREAGRSLVVSSAVPLASIAFAMPDLHSRLSWGLRLRLEPLDDAAKGEVLDRRARALGIVLPEDVRRFLLIRTSRNLGRLVDSLEALRVAALAGKRRLTLPLAREVLGAD